MQGLFIQGMENQTKETEINSSEINNQSFSKHFIPLFILVVGSAYNFL
jgi:hypothetical protein